VNKFGKKSIFDIGERKVEESESKKKTNKAIIGKANVFGKNSGYYI
jgi:hypothetical protein